MKEFRTYSVYLTSAEVLRALRASFSSPAMQSIADGAEIDVTQNGIKVSWTRPVRSSDAGELEVRTGVTRKGIVA